MFSFFCRACFGLCFGWFFCRFSSTLRSPFFVESTLDSSPPLLCLTCSYFLPVPCLFSSRLVLLLCSSGLCLSLPSNFLLPPCGPDSIHPRQRSAPLIIILTSVSLGHCLICSHHPCILISLIPHCTLYRVHRPSSVVLFIFHTLLHSHSQSRSLPNTVFVSFPYFDMCISSVLIYTYIHHSTPCGSLPHRTVVVAIQYNTIRYESCRVLRLCLSSIIHPVPFNTVHDSVPPPTVRSGLLALVSQYSSLSTSSLRSTYRIEHTYPYLLVFFSSCLACPSV